MSLESLHNVWQGETVYVLGSGSSLNFIDPSFFDDKHCVAINFVGRDFGLKNFVTFTHYVNDAVQVASLFPDFLVVLLRWKDGERSTSEISNIINIDNISEPPNDSFNPYDFDGDGLVFGSSSIHGGMHLAAVMGAKNIVLVGADCGTIDGNNRFDGYPEGDTPWALYDNHLRIMKEWLQVNFNCSVYSLNPFVNFNLEGHKFVGV
jgi:hypothetical protein